MPSTDPPKQPVTGAELGAKICELFGLDPEGTADISISLSPNGAAQIQVRSWVWTDEADAIVNTLEEYRLVPKDEVAQ